MHSHSDPGLVGKFLIPDAESAKGSRWRDFLKGVLRWWWVCAAESTFVSWLVGKHKYQYRNENTWMGKLRLIQARQGQGIVLDSHSHSHSHLSSGSGLTLMGIICEGECVEIIFRSKRTRVTSVTFDIQSQPAERESVPIRLPNIGTLNSTQTL